MKTKLFFLMAILGVGAVQAVFGAEPGAVRLSLVQGDVQIYSKETQDWEPAEANLPVYEGDKLWVADDGKVELQIRGGIYVRGDSNTAIDLVRLDKEEAQLYIDRGHAYINNRRGGVDIVQVDTPTASVSSYDNSIMMLDINDDGGTGVSSLKGNIFVENRDGKTRISAGKTLTVGEEGAGEIAPIGPPDEWEHWNVARDREMTAWRESSRYLPDELHEYASDLDENGHWMFVRDYGYVWAPATVDPDWVPYSQGRWAWIGGDYVWVSMEVWGWAPFHYGRWTYVSGPGWCWVPPARGAVAWGPGFVGWVYTSDRVAWVPLAPGEVYYGRRAYGPGTANITVINKETVVRQQFRNITINNAVTVVRSDDFSRGGRPDRRLRGNPFVEKRALLGPPAVRPERRVPAQARVIAVPPERVRRTLPEEIRERRTIVRDRDMSVFRKERPASMPVRTVPEPKVFNRRVVRPAPQGGQPRSQAPAAQPQREHKENEWGHRRRD